MYSGIEVAKYAINRCNEKGKPISNLYLQKILYFIQSEYKQKTNEWLISDDFLAWPYGSVLKDVYDEYNWYYSSRRSEYYDDVDLQDANTDIVDEIIDDKRKKRQAS